MFLLNYISKQSTAAKFRLEIFYSVFFFFLAIPINLYSSGVLFRDHFNSFNRIRDYVLTLPFNYKHIDFSLTRILSFSTKQTWYIKLYTKHISRNFILVVRH